jgi:hypothetical protein
MGWISGTGERYAECNSARQQIKYLRCGKSLQNATKLRDSTAKNAEDRGVINPFVFGAIGHRRTRAARCPAFAINPQAHRPSTSHAQVRQLFAKRLLESFGGEFDAVPTAIVGSPRPASTGPIAPQ